MAIDPRGGDPWGELLFSLWLPVKGVDVAFRKKEAAAAS